MPKRLSTGIDLIEVDRFARVVQRQGERFLNRVFTSNELADCGPDTASLAARWAAKEAVAKALGTGIGTVRWREIEILRGAEREPILKLHTDAKKLAEEQNLSYWSISLSHSATHAIAMAVAIGED